MATPPGNTSDRSSSPPHLVSLVLQSKKALHQGRQICSHAHDLTIASSNHVVDVLALDAKIRWITQGIMDQLKAAAGVAKRITERRQKLEERAMEWDDLHTQHQEALDATLEVLSLQVVPPSFHQSAIEKTLFGIQASDSPDRIHDPDEVEFKVNDLDGRYKARKKWKTLRDFVDERGLEDVFESIEGERDALNVTLATTAAYPCRISAMSDQISQALRASFSPGDAILTRPSSRTLPSPSQDRALSVELPPLKDMSVILHTQEETSTRMAELLESLTTHHDQMDTALKDKDSGGNLGAEAMDVFIRDNAELPRIINELEGSIAIIQSARDEILAIKLACQHTLNAQSGLLDSLDELGDKMEVMLQQQNDIEVEVGVTYETLNAYLQSLITLRSTYETYQFSFNAMLIEMDRRKQHRDTVESVVREMRERLEKIREEEILARDEFYAAHSSSIPDDICLAISNLPQSYSITSFCKNSSDETEQEREVLPDIDDDLLEDARRRLREPSFSERIPEVLDIPSNGPLMRREDSFCTDLM